MRRVLWKFRQRKFEKRQRQLVKLKRKRGNIIMVYCPPFHLRILKISINWQKAKLDSQLANVEDLKLVLFFSC